MRDDELEIFFASGPDGNTFDLYTATRTSTLEPFGTPRRVDALSSAGNDWPVWTSPDGCDLYFINRPNNIATLYVARR